MGASQPSRRNGPIFHLSIYLFLSGDAYVRQTYRNVLRYSKELLAGSNQTLPRV